MLREEIKKIDSNIYKNKWQEIINSLLEIDYNKRINQVYDIKDIILNELNINIIIGEIYINKDNINKDIQIINSFDNWKREGNWKDKEDDYRFENEKEVKENIELKINRKIIEFSYYYTFEKEGKYIIDYIFKNNSTKTDHMFCHFYSLTNLNLSNFNTPNVTNMRFIFYHCDSLKKMI